MFVPKWLSRLDSSNDQYELLPSNGGSVSPFRRVVHGTPTRRRIFLSCALAIPLLLAISVYYNFFELRVAWTNVTVGTDSESSPAGSGPLNPPTYDEYFEIERNYPQHNASLPFPEGWDGRFMWVSNQHFGIGWNNIFQNLIMLSHVAYLSNRAFVFEPYTWDRGPNPFTQWNGHVIPSRIPLAALIDGPIAGAKPFPPDKPNSRSVSQEFFEKVCPERRRTKLSIHEMNEGLDGVPVIEVVEKYAAKLTGMAEGCVELYGTTEHPFDWMHFGVQSMIGTWPTLSESPVLRDFDWSPLALSALRSNAEGIDPVLAADPLPEHVPELMAIHVRRGDYEQHCQHLANWSSTYMGWAQFPGLPDKFTPPPGGGWGENTPENRAEYMLHCYPDIPRIIRRVKEAKHDWETRDDKPADQPPLRRLYVLTNGEREWVKELEQALVETGDFDNVLTSRDMTYTHEQKYIAQAIDMAIAQRAGLFMGTGFSSMTANIVLLRRIKDHPLVSNRFW